MSAFFYFEMLYYISLIGAAYIAYKALQKIIKKTGLFLVSICFSTIILSIVYKTSIDNAFNMLLVMITNSLIIYLIKIFIPVEK